MSDTDIVANEKHFQQHKPATVDVGAAVTLNVNRPP